jgi:glycosyltransferase involved in cell wall biosynthesis
MQSKSVAFITTCKGRLQHLKETLPGIVGQVPDEIIVVDYGCPDHAGDWARERFPAVKVININDDPGFCLARARNAGAAAAESEFLCFIDADVRINGDWLSWMRKNLDPRFVFRAARINGKRDLNTWGTVIVHRKAFELVGGYDEVYRGWGGEDDDLYLRLKIMGVPESPYPSAYVSAIEHDDSLRTTFHVIKKKSLNHAVNEMYKEAKLHLIATHRMNPRIPIETRQKVYSEIRTAFDRWQREDESKDPASIALSLRTKTAFPWAEIMLTKELNIRFSASVLEQPEIPTRVPGEA